MDRQMDTLKVCKHHQHARLQKEEDEMWISSEDLRTEGSSDEESPHKPHKRNKKQRKSDLLSPPSQSCESFAKESGCVSDYAPTSEIDKSTIERNLDFNLSGDNAYLADIFVDTTPSTSGISLGSSDSGMDALNLESRWRPKRGSLKYPMLVEGTSVEV